MRLSVSVACHFRSSLRTGLVAKLGFVKVKAVCDWATYCQDRAAPAVRGDN